MSQLSSDTPAALEGEVYTPSEVGSVEMSRDEAYRHAAKSAPTNDLGLPVYVFRPDMIPADIHNMPEGDRAAILTNASIYINYDEGFPTFDNGMAFWSQMPFEPIDAYELFEQYLQLGITQGVRRLEELFVNLKPTSGETAALIDGTRRTQIREYFTFYNWASRCKAYDLFQVVAHQKLRERRILSTTDQHFLKAEGLLGKLSAYFDKTNDEGELAWVSELTPKVAIDMLDKLTKMQRTALGLSAHGHAAGEDGGTSKNADVSVVLRQVATNAADPNASEGSDNSDDIALLLSNPDMAATAQELIIKVGEAARK